MLLDDALPLIIGSSGITAVLAAVITATFNRKKLKADATSVIATAAGGIVQILQEDNARLRDEGNRRETMRQRREAAERRRDATFRQQLEYHHQYDLSVASKLRSAGFEMEDPPPLTFPDYEYSDDFEFIQAPSQMQNQE